MAAEATLAALFDEIDVLILAQIDGRRIDAPSIGVGAMQVEHTRPPVATVTESFLPGARLETSVFGRVPPDGVASNSVSATERELVTTTTTDGVIFFCDFFGAFFALLDRNV
jgi:hypothetical protein